LPWITPLVRLKVIEGTGTCEPNLACFLEAEEGDLHHKNQSEVFRKASPRGHRENLTDPVTIRIAARLTGRVFVPLTFCGRLHKAWETSAFMGSAEPSLRKPWCALLEIPWAQCTVERSHAAHK
jgi:hypothetical protein